VSFPPRSFGIHFEAPSSVPHGEELHPAELLQFWRMQTVLKVNANDLAESSRAGDSPSARMNFAISATLRQVPFAPVTGWPPSKLCHAPATVAQ